ncbi:VanZ family protein [Psychromonas antarctica]|jgi:VanZ family protein|uniref:VanZ family protein n=1 Tax=Psychromonas antarctica TaxID=67573 RepID=UPI001EE975C4|nr:VanZ family protein [Psychromonas antarctica]MCG6202068.1 VanZ family protein [Psychromonas antarctica]
MTTLLTKVCNYWLACSIFALVVIALLSLNPMSHLPAVPGGDKSHHIIAYALLMFPAALHKPKYWLLIGFLFLCFSGAIELLQPFVSRTADWLDMSANLAGMVLGILLAQLISWRFIRSPNQD